MDPFTQRILERAEQRSKTLGISKTTKFPLSEFEQKASQKENKMQVIEKFETVNTSCFQGQKSGAVATTTSSPSRIHRQYSVDKENVDVGIEINITAGPNIDVQVEVEDQEIDSAGNTISVGKKQIEQVAKIRDCSRNRLQRLGALYSDTDNLSSPIHRTEGKFHEDDTDMTEASIKSSKQKYGRLVALADSIKSWEDDTSHPDYKHSKIDEIKSMTISPIKKISNDQSNATSNSNIQRTITHTGQQPTKTESKGIKQLTWDKNVMDSLEAQGFQRRESSNTKISYEYKEDDKISNRTINKKQLNPVVEKMNKLISSSAEEKRIPNIKSGLVSGRAAVFEVKTQNVLSKAQKDPAEMSLKERMMLFEKNKGKALMPKAAFAMSAPVSSNKTQDEMKLKRPEKQTIEIPKVAVSVDTKVKEKVAALTAGSKTISEYNIKADIIKQRQEDMHVIATRFNKQKEIIKESEIEVKTPVLASHNPVTITPPPPPPPPPMPAIGSTPMQQLATQHIEPKYVINNTNKRRSPGNAIEDISIDLSSDDVKRLKVNPKNIPGRIYPVLSDIDTTESENDNCTTATVSPDFTETKRQSMHYSDEDLNESYMESEDDADICNVSLGREIMQAVQANEAHKTPNKKEVRYAGKKHDVYYEDSSINTTRTSEDSADIDDYLDEALEDDEESDCKDTYSRTNNTNGTTSSNSFSYQKKPNSSHHQQSILEKSDDYNAINQNQLNYRNPVKSELTVDPSNDNDIVTLVHTVSFYRRQQSSNSNNSTPVRRIQREQISPSSYGSNNNKGRPNNEYEEEEINSEQDVHIVQEKIKKLLDEVCKQQQVIAQTSQALNLCASTIEFSGSTESVEGERHLLVATHRRQAALDEVQRLRVEGCIRPHGAPNEKGRLTVKEIRIPLRQDYISKLSADKISGHHLVCLLKYNETVLATKSIPTLPGLLAVKFPDLLQLNNVYADFKITLEIYGMTAQREVLPHEVKYHINLNKKSGAKTPKKKNLDSRLIMPMVQSPAGPNVVRTPALIHYGFAIFSLREIQRNSWTLNQITGVSPLEGTVHMKITCELSVSVEYKGFLTMFEDISGFGAWHRRWCHLNGHVLNFWKYPDDEKKKAPMGSIDLYSCCSSKITTAPRDDCSRLNTLLLECQRPAEDNDVQSLLIVPKGNITIVRYLLAADSKEERDEWSAHLNKTLTLLRAWGSQ